MLGIEFGEKLLYKVKPKEKQEKINARWEYGIFVGVRRKSGELWISTEDEGVFGVRSVRRIPVEDRWGEDCSKWVKRALWNKYKGDEYADGEVPEGIIPEEVKTGSGDKIIIIETRKKVTRDFGKKKAEGEKHG